MFDADVLPTLVCSETAQDAVMRCLRGRRIVTTAVADETLHAGAGSPLDRTGLKTHARRLVVNHMERVEVTELGDEAVQRMADIQAALRQPGDSNRKHLGEAASIAAAVELQGLLATHDRDATSIARREGVRVITVATLLEKAVRSGELTSDERSAAEDAMRLRGRTPPSR